VSAKHAVIAIYRETYPVRLMCAALGVSVSGYYAAQRRAPSPRRQAEAHVRAQVRIAYAESRRRYGAPRIHQVLRAEGTRVAKKRVARLMREEGLVARPKRRWVRTPEATSTAAVPANHLARRFAVAAVAGRDRV
jgi:putative transposase